MSKKIWFVIAASLVIVGLIMFAVVMTANNWDFAKLGTGKYETNTYGITEEFHSISIKTDTADILFIATDDETCKVVCYDQENIKYSVNVQDGKLVIDTADDREWYEYIGMNFNTAEVTVYLPANEYTSLYIKESTGDIEIPKEFKFADVDISVSTGDVKFYASALELIKIKASTGSIRVENISAGALDLSVSTGKVTVSDLDCTRDVNIKVSTGKSNLTDIRCRNLTSRGDTGDISLKNVIVTEKLSIKRSTGDVRFDRSDAAEIFVQTDTGEVTGSLLSDKIFIARSDTGRVNVPKTVTGGKCEITTDTGDIRITVAP